MRWAVRLLTWLGPGLGLGLGCGCGCGLGLRVGAGLGFAVRLLTQTALGHVVEGVGGEGERRALLACGKRDDGKQLEHLGGRELLVRAKVRTRVRVRVRVRVRGGSQCYARFGTALHNALCCAC